MVDGPFLWLTPFFFFFVKVLAGDNKFLCAHCDKKRDTLKRTCIARLPNVLILHLKRFEFDMEQMRKVRLWMDYDMIQFFFCFLVCACLLPFVVVCFVF